MVVKTKKTIKNNQLSSKNLFSIEGKIILISGSGKGIGRHLAQSMAQNSAIVYCIDKNFPQKIPKNIEFHLLF